MDMDELLARIPLFSGLHGDLLARLAEITAEEQRPEGETIWRQGDAADGMYAVLDGAVRFEAGELACLVEAGDSFGEDALVDDSPRASAAVCEAQTRLVVIRRADFEDLLFVDRDLAYDLLWRLSRAFAARSREPGDRVALLQIAGKL
jgi:CRP/FNR family transcriptional regulator, cyclic AMP receptor protein